MRSVFHKSCFPSRLALQKLPQRIEVDPPLGTHLKPSHSPAIASEYPNLLADHKGHQANRKHPKRSAFARGDLGLIHDCAAERW